MIAIAEEVWPDIKTTLLVTGAVHSALVGSARFYCIVTDEKGAIQVFNLGAGHMFGFSAAEVLRKTPADLCDAQELISRAAAVTQELGTPVAAGFEALACKAARGGEDTFALTWLRKNGSRMPSRVSITALRGAGEAIVGYLLMGTDDPLHPEAQTLLPLATSAGASAERSKPLALVVDDDDQSANLLRRFLEGEGFAVVCSISAEEALLETAEREFAVILLDLQLYSMNGWQFLKKLHDTGSQVQVPVIIIAGRPVEDDLLQTRGVFAALQKPIHLNQLRMILYRLGLLEVKPLKMARDDYGLPLVPGAARRGAELP